MARTEHFLEFERLTNFPIISLVNKIKSFYEKDYNLIVEFYQGERKQINKDVFVNLNVLVKDTENCINKFDENKEIFDKGFFWEILDGLEDLKFSLYKSLNLSKFLRSSILKSSNKSGYLVSVTLDNGQTLENVSEKILNDENSEDDWVEIAVSNDLKEQNWDIDGGKEILVRKRIFQANLVTSFIDNTIGTKIYGRDFQNKLEFDSNQQDLKILNEKETLNQTIITLATLSKGDIPENKSLGMNSNLYKGVNRSQLDFPAIGKDLKRNFNSDDLFNVVNILEIIHEQGDIFIKFEVGTKIGEVFIKDITI